MLALVDEKHGGVYVEYVKSVQSTFSHRILTSVLRATFTRLSWSME